MILVRPIEIVGQGVRDNARRSFLVSRDGLRAALQQGTDHDLNFGVEGGLVGNDAVDQTDGEGARSVEELADSSSSRRRARGAGGGEKS